METLKRQIKIGKNTIVAEPPKKRRRKKRTAGMGQVEREMGLTNKEVVTTVVKQMEREQRLTTLPSVVS